MCVFIRVGSQRMLLMLYCVLFCFCMEKTKKDCMLYRYNNTWGKENLMDREIYIALFYLGGMKSKRRSEIVNESWPSIIFIEMRKVVACFYLRTQIRNTAMGESTSRIRKLQSREREREGEDNNNTRHEHIHNRVHATRNLDYTVLLIAPHWLHINLPCAIHQQKVDRHNIAICQSITLEETQ